MSRTATDCHTDPLLVTPVDALDTLILMGLGDETDRTREFFVSRDRSGEGRV